MWWWGRGQTGSKRVKDNSNVHGHESLFRHGGGEGGRQAARGLKTTEMYRAIITVQMWWWGGGKQAARGLKITAMYTAMNNCSDMVVGKGADRQQEG